ncbi:unnamed protein product, partial [Polarella glacialis]
MPTETYRPLSNSVFSATTHSSDSPAADAANFIFPPLCSNKLLAALPSRTTLPEDFRSRSQDPKQFLRKTRTAPTDFRTFAMWNVEGLNADNLDTKLTQLIQIMRRRRIAVLCIQETHVAGSIYFSLDGFLVIFSGGTSDQRETAGVGFIVAPWAK